MRFFELKAERHGERTERHWSYSLVLRLRPKYKGMNKWSRLGTLLA